MAVQRGIPAAGITTVLLWALVSCRPEKCRQIPGTVKVPQYRSHPWWWVLSRVELDDFINGYYRYTGVVAKECGTGRVLLNELVVVFVAENCVLSTILTHPWKKHHWSRVGS